MAHRGGRHGGRPNTPAAIGHANSVGAGCCEVDVNQTADGVLVATHDGIVGTKSWITDCSYDELLNDDRDEWADRRLHEVIEFALGQQMVAYLDIKSISPAGINEIADAWSAEAQHGQVIFASARGDVVSWINGNRPELKTSFLYYDRLLDLRTLSAFMQPTFVHPCFDHLRDPFRSMTAAYVERARELGYGLVSWSENDPDSVRQLADLGFDFICTDEPEMAYNVVTGSPAPAGG